MAASHSRHGSEARRPNTSEEEEGVLGTALTVWNEMLMTMKSLIRR